MLLSPQLGNSASRKSRISIGSVQTQKAGKIAKENKQLRKQLRNLQEMMTTDKILAMMKKEAKKCFNEC